MGTIEKNKDGILSTCICCGGDFRDEACIDLGMQPVSSHFHKADSFIKKNRIVVSQCGNCGIVQLNPPIPYVDICSPHEWIKYREPEDHLDDMVEKLIEILGENKNIRTLGVSYKDVTTLERIRDKGYSDIAILDLERDLLSPVKNANIESVPGLLSQNRAKILRKEKGPFQIVVARHALEHAERPVEFLSALSELLDDNGLLVIEVPDCEENMMRGDISMIWEEHAIYLTMSTLQSLLSTFGYSVIRFEDYELTFENSLVVFGKKSKIKTCSELPVTKQFTLFDSFRDKANNYTIKLKQYFEKATSVGEKFAIYGAGHLATAFINFYRVEDYIECVIDDTVEKQGYLLTGTRLEIKPSSELTEKGISICFLALSVEVEDKVLDKNRSYCDHGGEFYSTLIASPRSFTQLLQENQ